MPAAGETRAPAQGGHAADGRAVLDALAGRPGGAELLEAGAAGADIALVGGAVRDLLLGAEPRELDVVTGADAHELASELAPRLGAAAAPTHHERFGTAVVEWGAGRIDIAQRRAESYAQPGALPEVRPGSVEEDLNRRDFTVNALAVALGGERRGELQAAEHGLEDLGRRRLRVLHDASFSDDPTRLLRLARYGARLGFAIEENTAELAAAALAASALDTVSGARIGAELRLALAEADALGALEALQDLGVLAGIDPALTFARGRAADALVFLPADASREVLLLASLLPRGSTGDADVAERAAELLDRLEFSAQDRDRAVESATGAVLLAQAMKGAERPSQLHETLARRPLQAVALAGADGDRAVEAAAHEWFDRLRHVGLEINGDDLLAAGVPAGPEIGARLAATLRLRLDGEIPGGRDAELRAALEVPA